MSLHKAVVFNVTRPFLGEEDHLTVWFREKKLLTSYPVGSPLFMGKAMLIFLKISTKLTYKTVHPRFVTDMSI